MQQNLLWLIRGTNIYLWILIKFIKYSLQRTSFCQFFQAIFPFEFYERFIWRSSHCRMNSHWKYRSCSVPQECLTQKTPLHQCFPRRQGPPLKHPHRWTHRRHPQKHTIPGLFERSWADQRWHSPRTWSSWSHGRVPIKRPLNFEWIKSWSNSAAALGWPWYIELVFCSPNKQWLSRIL